MGTLGASSGHCQVSGVSTENLCLSSALSEESLLESEEAPLQPQPQSEADQSQEAGQEGPEVRIQCWDFTIFISNKHKKALGRTKIRYSQYDYLNVRS